MSLPTVVARRFGGFRERTHAELADFIWKICNLLRGPYKRNEYRKVILPLTVLRRFDCVLADTKAAVLAQAAKVASHSDEVRHRLLVKAAGIEADPQIVLVGLASAETARHPVVVPTGNADAAKGG